MMQDNPKHAEGTSNRRKIIEKFWIDYARCMRCNICVEVCNFEAIVMDNNWTGHEHSSFDRRDLHIDIDGLLDASKQRRLVAPFRPQDSIELLEKQANGEEAPADQRSRRAARGAPGAARPHRPRRRPRHPGARAGEAEGAARRQRAPRLGRRGRGRDPLRIEDPGQAHARRARGQGVHRTAARRCPPRSPPRIEMYRNMKPGEAAVAPGAAAAGGGVRRARCSPGHA